MNNTELKTHFYKRFNCAAGRLVLTQAGLPVSLAGSINSDVIPGIGCSLSMRVRVIGANTGDNSVTVTSTSSDMRRIYDFNSPDSRDRVSGFISRAGAFELRGCELLTDTTIPPVFDSHITYTAAVCKAIMELSDNDLPSPEICAGLCALKDERSLYITEFASRSGYCVYCDGRDFKRLPLPMTGCAFIIAAVKGTSGLLDAGNIRKTFNSIKKHFPHITSFSDVTPSMLEAVSPALKSYAEKTCARHFTSECARAGEAERALKACDIRDLAAVMNESFLSQKHLCADNDKRVFLCDELYLQNGVLGVRICEQGVLALVREDDCDSIINSAGFSFENEFGNRPLFCIADSI